MQTFEYHLYRVKFIKSQEDLFISSATPREIFNKALHEKPSIESRKDVVWHLGNLEYFDPDSGRFAVGRNTKATLEKFDNFSGNFNQIIDDSGPYTWVYFDTSIGLIGIGKKSKVAPDTKTIAQHISRLLSRTISVADNRVVVRVDYIPDPESFIQKVYQAYSVKRFEASFTGPNPIDADELFQKPLSNIAKGFNAVEGNISIMGMNLNPDTVVDVAKSTAATGNKASATIQLEKGSRPTRIAFKGDPAKVVTGEIEEKHGILYLIKRLYKEIRDDSREKG